MMLIGAPQRVAPQQSTTVAVMGSNAPEVVAVNKMNNRVEITGVRDTPSASLTAMTAATQRRACLDSGNIKVRAKE
jgi:hypothetical protein